MKINKIELCTVTINATTRKASNFIHAYDFSNYKKITKVYKKPSYTKINSFNKIYEEMKKVHGYDLRITGHNNNTYSCAYRVYNKADKANYLIYHTYFYRYAIKLDI